MALSYNASMQQYIRATQVQEGQQKLPMDQGVQNKIEAWISGNASCQWYLCHLGISFYMKRFIAPCSRIRFSAEVVCTEKSQDCCRKENSLHPQFLQGFACTSLFSF